MSPVVLNLVFAALVGLGTLVALLVFFWRRSGLGSGRRFGNRVAAHLGIPKALFHALLDHGVQGSSSRQLLAAVEASTPDLDQAGLALAPSLARGVERLEAHFGTQDAVNEVKPIVARLVSQTQTRTQTQTQTPPQG